MALCATVALIVAGMSLSMTPTLATEEVQEQKMLIIVNEGVATESLTKEQVEDIYLGSIKKWEGGSFIYLTIGKEDEYNHEFLETYVHLSPQRFTSHWKRLVFTGQGLEPRKLKNAKDIVAFVKKRKGAIGFIPPNQPHEGVKVIQIVRDTKKNDNQEGDEAEAITNALEDDSL